ncbi:MAG: hypothetical protein IJB96_00945 [Lachnospira sp.]|nr:hypothetical protein [Lachnospira sp.]
MRVNKLLALLLCFAMVFSSLGFSVFAEELPEQGCSVIIYNEDGTVGMEIDGTNSASPFKLSTQLEDAYAFINNAGLFGITGTPSIYIEMYEDSNDDAVAQIKYKTEIVTNGFSLSDFEIADDAVDGVKVTVDGNDATPAPPVLVWDGVSYDLDWLKSGNPEATAGDEYYLKSVNDLAGLAYYVNTYSSTNNIFTGDTIYLTVDVDLAGFDWTPIGTMETDKNHFYGSFDGQGHTISNLTISADSEQIYGGLFGRFKGSSFNQTFSNLTIHNVDIATVASSDGKEGAGALMGYGYGQVIDNVHVTGNINISGNSYVGGLVGHSRSNISNSTVDATGNITGKSTVGGLVGYFVHAAGNGVDAAINDCSVNGVAVEANKNAGGLVGFVSATNADKIVIDNVTVSETSVKALEGNATELAFNFSNVTNSTVDNVTAEVCVAKIGDVYYTTLKEAIYNAVDGDTIYLIGTINEGSIKLPATIRNLTIDGQNTAVVKDTVITAADGNHVDVQGFTVKNTTFDNSRFVLGGQRAGDVIYKDLVFEGNTFTNIVNTSSMAAVHMNIASEDNEYVENFKFIGNTIDGVTGSSNSGVLMKNAKGDVIFEGNTISNVVNNAIQCINAKADINLVIKNNNLSADLGSVLNLYNVPAVTLENNTFNLNEGQKDLGNFSAVATIGNTYYANLQAAVDAAEEGDTIVLANDIEYEVNPTADSTNTDSNCLIHTDKDDVITLDLNGKTISVKGSDEAKYDTLAIRNNGNLTIVDNGIARSAGTITLAYDGTQEVGSSQIHSTILNFGTLTVDGGNIKNTATSGKARYAIYNYSWGGNANVTINGGSIDSDSTLALYTSAYDDFSKNTCNVTINGGEIDGVWYSNTGATAGASLTITGGDFGGDYNGAAVTIKEPAAGNTTLAVTGGNFVKSENDSIIYSSTDASVAAFISGGTFSSNVSAYAAEGYDVVRAADKYVVEPENAQADSISVEYVDVTEAGVEGEKTYEIVVKADDGDVINELASVDLSFVYTTAPVTGGNIDFTVAPAEKFAMTRYENTNRYMFNYNGVGNNYEGTAAEITVGTIKVVGYGKFTIATDTADTNIVNATTVNDNLVDSYTVAGATDNDATTGALDITGNVDTEIAVPVRTLTINIDFPNAVVDNAIAYQDMKVEITGTIDGVNKTVVYNLGEDEVAMTNGDYVVVEDALVLNNAYTVTVSGAGYRTARYTVTMTDDKQLNFWNNVMDEAQVVELGKDSSVAKVTFLAGDIVKDNNINIYDLSAVVSYFGTETNTAAYDAYAKYDLNRDGVIDSKDVAYVLVSWNN